MLVDLLPTFSRFNVERFPSSLVVLIPYGEIRGPIAPSDSRVTFRSALESVYEGSQGSQHYLAFHIRPGGTPTYSDLDAVGWDYSIQLTDEKGTFRTYNTVSLIQEGSRWVVRLRDGRVPGSIDATIPEFDPDVRDSLAFDEGIGEHIPDVWERLMAAEGPV